MRNTFLMIVFCSLIFNCKTKLKQISSSDEVGIDPYIENVIVLLEKNSIQKNEIDWPKIRDDVKRKLTYSPTDSIRHEIIKEIIKKNNLKHHSFMTPKMAEEWKNKSSSNQGSHRESRPSLVFSESKILENEIGYLIVPMFTSGDSLQLVKYASKLQKFIKEISHKKKWIVDLRGNMGGNMWPMIVGLGPLLGEEKLGNFNRQDQYQGGSWFYNNGEGFIEKNTSKYVYLKITPKLTVLTNDKIALLIDKNTMSSGEAVAISFFGNSNTKTFGSKSGGYTTGNSSFILEDGSIIYITTSIYADCNLKVYPDGIIPDQVIVDSSEVLWEAKKWLLSFKN